MSTLTYIVNNRTFHLSKEEIRPFNNDDSFHCISDGARTEFVLKDGTKITGIVEKIEYAYPVPFSDNSLQSKIFVKNEDNEASIIWFYDIDSHRPAPLLKK